MHPHKITDGSTQEAVEIDQAASDQWAPVLGGNHHHVGIELFGCCAQSAALGEDGSIIDFGILVGLQIEKKCCEI